jgi:hypothetical protein
MKSCSMGKSSRRCGGVGGTTKPMVGLGFRGSKRRSAAEQRGCRKRDMRRQRSRGAVRWQFGTERGPEQGTGPPPGDERDEMGEVGKGGKMACRSGGNLDFSLWNLGAALTTYISTTATHKIPQHKHYEGRQRKSYTCWHKIDFQFHCKVLWNTQNAHRRTKSISKTRVSPSLILKEPQN